MNPRPLGPEPSALPSALHPDKGYDGVERSAHIMSAANNKVLKQSFRFLHPEMNSVEIVDIQVKASFKNSPLHLFFAFNTLDLKVRQNEL